MRLDFPYKDVPALEIPDDNFLGYFKPKLLPHGQRVDAVIGQALSNPIGSPPLSDLVSAGKRVAIICDDITRKTPAHVLLPPVILEIQRAGVKRDAIKIVVASGTHRKMTAAEKQQKFSKVICDQYEIVDHDWRDESRLVEIGHTSSGMKVLINRTVAEADLVVGVGHVVPHRCTGFSGGAKAIFPGVADKDAIAHLHWASTDYPTNEILGLAENPIRAMIDEVGALAGLRFIVNVIQDDSGNIADIVTGHMQEAHRAGCAKASEVFGVHIPQAADIVIADSFPADIDLWQAMKAAFAMELAVRDGGVIIIVSPCHEGISPVHGQLSQFGYRPPSEVKQMVADGKLTDLVVAAHLIWGGMAIKERATGILVSHGVSAEERARMGFMAMDTPQEALEQAFKLKGEDAKVLAFHHGAEVLPVPLTCDLPVPNPPDPAGAEG